MAPRHEIGSLPQRMDQFGKAISNLMDALKVAKLTDIERALYIRDAERILNSYMRMCKRSELDYRQRTGR